jgi:hypothetical protein
MLRYTLVFVCLVFFFPNNGFTQSDSGSLTSQLPDQAKPTAPKENNSNDNAQPDSKSQSSPGPCGKYTLKKEPRTEACGPTIQKM